MIVIILLGGKGERFKNNGYTVPKPLIPIFGKPIIEWLIDNLNFDKIDNIIIPYNEELSKYNFEEYLKNKYLIYKFTFKLLKYETRGAAETLYDTLNDLCKLNISDQPILSLDGDNFYTTDIIKEWGGKNKIFCFEDISDNPIYSYVEYQDNKIINIVEKNKISNYACCGAYGFNSWKKLMDGCKYVIDNDIRSNNEFYISNVVKNMLENEIFKIQLINKSKYICLGTPIQVRLFVNNYPRISAFTGDRKVEPKRYCFDLDNTLVTYPEIPGDYTTVKPIEKNIKIVQYLKKFDNTIIIHTARRMKTHDGNLGKVISDIANITINTLNKFNIPYDELYFGKPYADFYIDDKAISSFNDLEKELGYYNSLIEPRDFNKIETSVFEIYNKKSNNLEGEIKYYKSIPSNIKDIFPIFINHRDDNSEYTMEKIDGITLSSIYVSENMNEKLLYSVCNTLKRIHSIKPNEIVPNIYLNYSKKLEQRYHSYYYGKYEKHKEIYDYLHSKLNEYESKKLAKCSMIHGDPVFTNILLNQYEKIKMIDMRGKIGDIYTIYGDELYDWAKLYQSLIGYDEILNCKKIRYTYKNDMLLIFKKIFLEIYDDNYWKYLQIICASLLFTLIPLHDNNKCFSYYNLIFELIKI